MTGLDLNGFKELQIEMNKSLDKALLSRKYAKWNSRVKSPSC